MKIFKKEKTAYLKLSSGDKNKIIRKAIEGANAEQREMVRRYYVGCNASN